VEPIQLDPKLETKGIIVAKNNERNATFFKLLNLVLYINFRNQIITYRLTEQ